VDEGQPAAGEDGVVTPDAGEGGGEDLALTLPGPAGRSKKPSGARRSALPTSQKPDIALLGPSSAYMLAIMQAAPALADIFAPPSLEAVAKPLSERSTDELVVQIDAGRFLAEIARLWGVPTSDLNRWVAMDAQRFERANLARRNQAALWDWVALQVLLHAPSNRVEIVRAEKIAQHCRWRSKVFDRHEYGQNVKVTQVDEREARELTTRELKIIAQGGVLPV
jgi:hypothetical protein